MIRKINTIIRQNCHLFLVIILCGFGIYMSSCDTVSSRDINSEENELISNNESSIKFTVSGGITGGLLKKMIIDSTGTVILPVTRRIYPELKQQLTPEGYGMLVEAFENFVDISESLPDTVVNRCSDDVYYEIELSNHDIVSSYTSSGCSLFYGSDSSFVEMKELVDILDTLYDNVYENQIPWKGLTGEFTIDSDSYALGEPIKMIYTIHNPTSKNRGLYFRGEVQTYFQLYKQNTPSFYFLNPDFDDREIGEPSKILFNPGETKIIETVWDQMVKTNEGEIPLEIGRYRINLNMFSGGFSSSWGVIDIFDPSIPIFAHILAGNNDSSSRPDYTFKLAVKNWGDQPITLNFPSSQRMWIRLYGDEHKNSIDFESPQVDDSIESTVIIQPGEEKVFSKTVIKSHISNLSYTWKYVEIELMCTNFESISTGSLQIIKYRPN